MRLFITFFGLLTTAFILGCGGGNAPSTKGAHDQDKNGKDKGDHAVQLTPADQTLADAQGYCVVSGGRLGSMGAPVKLSAKGEPVFVCCEACEKSVRERPDEMLVKRDEMKAKVSKEHGVKK